jgi:hypothetical protein
MTGESVNQAQTESNCIYRLIRNGIIIGQMKEFKIDASKRYIAIKSNKLVPLFS